MALGADDVRHVAALARLRVGDADAARLGDELGRVLDLLAEVDAAAAATHAATDPVARALGAATTAASAAASAATDTVAPRRPDVPRPEADRAPLAEAVLRQSAGRVGRGVRVPAVKGG